MNESTVKTKIIVQIIYTIRASLDGETIDIFEAVDDKFVDEKIFNVAKTKWAEATDTCQISDVKHGL